MLHNINIPGPNNQNQINQGFMKVMNDIAETMQMSPGKTKYSVCGRDLHPDIVSQVILAMSLIGWHITFSRIQYFEIVAVCLTNTFGR